jgi:hypothetical protein
MEWCIFNKFDRQVSHNWGMMTSKVQCGVLYRHENNVNKIAEGNAL